ncbi:hypothetical protein K2173_000933 [Erythroxylum novogranatense]|uniref:Retrovirus-related Pol polyprotein from transposon TNT 1-94 n=1 Tax=Erythroxylum novogranatense TaxID=1862640 RepID=A0AAV8TTR1_9ROSI|nr:hypothetical protein K2173_000933 [Erythroxylum novogranatense]
MAPDDMLNKIDKFDGTDFEYWKMHIEDYLYQKNQFLPLFGKKPENMSEEEWVILDRQALGAIRMTLSRNIAFNVLKAKTTKALMEELTEYYEKPSAVNKVHLMRRLFNLKMAEGTSEIIISMNSTKS